MEETFGAIVADRREKMGLSLWGLSGQMGGTPGPSFLSRLERGTQPGESVQYVIDAFREAGSYIATAKLLNSRGIKARHGIWWHATVRDIIKREAPTLAPVTEQQGRRARGKFIFAGVLQCPHCDGRLTGRRRAAHRTDYHCAHKKVDARHPHISIKEADMIGWMSERFAQLPMPTDVVAEEDVEAQRAELMRSRERIADNYVIGVYSREQRDERLVELQAKLEAIDQAGVPLNIGPIPWDAPPAQVNTTLRAFVRRVQFDAATHRPLEVQWAVPGWNVAGAGKAGHAATRQEARPASREHVPIAPIAEEGR